MVAVEVFHPEDGHWWARVHRAGCRDVGREVSEHGGRVWATEAATERGLIEEVAEDFIFFNDQQPWTDYIDQVNLAPCLKLPREEA